MRMGDGVNAPNGVYLNCNVDLERDCDDEEQEDEEEEDDMEEKVVDENKEEDKDNNDGKDPGAIGQREMVNTSAEDVDTMGDNHPILQPGQGQEMRKHTPRPQSPVPAPQLETPEYRPWP
jgi:hypothetical protein